MRVLFRCGHLGKFVEGRTPACRECGQPGIARIFAPDPRFVGKASGPLVRTEDLGAAVVTLSAAPLSLRSTEPTSDGQ